jgi:two-component system OmpR family sensor kinase
VAGVANSGKKERVRQPLARLPIRVRLAASVAVVVFGILTVIAIAVGVLVAHRLRSDFANQVSSQVDNLADDIHPAFGFGGGGDVTVPSYFNEVTGVANGVARVLSPSGHVLWPSNAPDLGAPGPTHQSDGYMVATATTGARIDGGLYVQYGVPVAPLASEISNLELLLALSVLAGTILAFGAGSLVARRAIMPIAALTEAAGEIERTRDPDQTLPTPVADDEVAELSRTLSAMLASLSAARSETELTLARERPFVADASHELRTPLTSVLANLELLVESVDDDDRPVARSALRSTQRMRRLVGDLLLLARADAGQNSLTKRVDLAEILMGAASELRPASQQHFIQLDAQPAPIVGVPDQLTRLAINLLDNAIRHTPPRTRITASTRALPDGGAELVVADDGPGIHPFLREHVFERFVRGSGEVAGSSGLGLAIAATVAQAHNGSIELTAPPSGGTQFVVRLGNASPPESRGRVDEPSADRLWSQD